MAIADAAVELTAALVGIDTVNPALVPGAPGERPAVELLARRLEAGGFAIEVVGPRERPSLLATARGRGGGPSLALNGHLDTVGAGAMPEPFTARIDGDRMTGRGSCDMKGGVAAMVVAAEQAAAAGTGGDVVLALVADEEHGSIGTEAVLDHLDRAGALPAACIVGEPTWLDVAVAHRGFAVVEVELAGRAAHSSRPQEGSNAVAHLGRLLAAIEAWDGQLARRPPHPHAGIGSLMATVAHGGEAPFSLAAKARAVVERRTVPGEPPGVAVAEVESVLEALAAQDPGFDGRCREVLARDPWQASDDPATARLLELIDGGMEAVGRAAPRRFGAPYWMESALWQAAGVPTLVWGPAGGGLHADDEWLDLSQLRDHAVALSRLVAAFCA
jgi:acetylornithine deacetylase